MESLSRFVAFVNEQAVFHENMAGKYAREPRRAEKHTATAATLRELARELEAASTPASAGLSKPSQLFVSLEEIDTLPDELVNELSVSEGDKTDYAILRIVDQRGGVASLDRILVDLFKGQQGIFKRNTLTSRLYRMTQKGLLCTANARAMTPGIGVAIAPTGRRATSKSRPTNPPPANCATNAKRRRRQELATVSR